jgi:hypothetical protein
MSYFQQKTAFSEYMAIITIKQIKTKIRQKTLKIFPLITFICL